MTTINIIEGRANGLSEVAVTEAGSGHTGWLPAAVVADARERHAINDRSARWPRHRRRLDSEEECA